MRIFDFTKTRMKSKPMLLVGLIITVLVGVLLFLFIIIPIIPTERTWLQAIIVPYTYNGDI